MIAFDFEGSWATEPVFFPSMLPLGKPPARGKSRPNVKIGRYLARICFDFGGRDLGSPNKPGASDSV